VEDQLLSGVIDRCVLGIDGDRVVRAELIDFKTDVRPKKKDLDEWIGERLVYHGPQLRAYGKAIKKQYGLTDSDVELTLLLLGEDRILTVPSR
jgi:hypothetical protein